MALVAALAADVAEALTAPNMEEAEAAAEVALVAALLAEVTAALAELLAVVA